MSTPDVGAGFAPAGFSPAGWGTPATATPPGGIVFRDPATGQSLSCRRIDPTTGQYVLDASGRVLGMTTAQQLMYLAMKTVKGSSAYAVLGQTISTIQDITSGITRVITDIVTDATADIVAAKLVVIDAVTVAPIGTTGEFVTVSFTDLETSLEQTVTA